MLFRSVSQSRYSSSTTKAAQPTAHISPKVSSFLHPITLSQSPPLVTHILSFSHSLTDTRTLFLVLCLPHSHTLILARTNTHNSFFACTLTILHSFSCFLLPTVHHSLSLSLSVSLSLSLSLIHTHTLSLSLILTLTLTLTHTNSL